MPYSLLHSLTRHFATLGYSRYGLHSHTLPFYHGALLSHTLAYTNGPTHAYSRIAYYGPTPYYGTNRRSTAYTRIRASLAYSRLLRLHALRPPTRKAKAHTPYAMEKEYICIIISIYISLPDYAAQLSALRLSHSSQNTTSVSSRNAQQNNKKLQKTKNRIFKNFKEQKFKNSNQKIKQKYSKLNSRIYRTKKQKFQNQKFKFYF